MHPVVSSNTDRAWLLFFCMECALFPVDRVDCLPRPVHYETRTSNPETDLLQPDRL